MTKRLLVVAVIAALVAVGIAVAAVTAPTTQTFTYTVPGTTLAIPTRTFTQTVTVPTSTVTTTVFATTTAPTTTTTPTPGPWVVAPPQAPITTVTDPYSLGLNVNNVVGQSFHDYVIDGGGDSSVLLQGATHNDSFSRFKITRTAANPVVTYGKHGMYVDGYSNTFTDISLDNTGGHGNSAISDRMSNNTFTRTTSVGYQVCLSFFEQDAVAGVTTFTNARCSFTDTSTAIWVDNGGDPAYPTLVHESFVISHMDVTGPSTAKFFAAEASHWDPAAKVTLICDTINGRPDQASDVSGVPAADITVQGC